MLVLRLSEQAWAEPDSAEALYGIGDVRAETTLELVTTVRARGSVHYED